MAGMPAKRGKWTSLGGAGTAALGLPPRRAQALALQHGWRTVAGERMAESVRADAVRGGVLELYTEGKAWRDAVLPALPALAARLASQHPQLGIRKVRLRLEGEVVSPPAQPVPAASPSPPVRAGAPPRAADPKTTADDEDDAPVEVRLTRLARGYLEGAARKRERR
jgi:hypothetical protein